MIALNRLTALFVSSALLGLTACGDSASEMGEDAVEFADFTENGRSIVEANCLNCHAVSSGDVSPRTDAPPLSKVLANYNPESLGDDFREGIHVGHQDMPDFDFGSRGTESVIAYLQSIQDPS